MKTFIFTVFFIMYCYVPCYANELIFIRGCEINGSSFDLITDIVKKNDINNITIRPTKNYVTKSGIEFSNNFPYRVYIDIENEIDIKVYMNNKQLEEFYEQLKDKNK